MVWPWRRKTRKAMARIAIEGPIAGATRTRVLKALKQVQDRECAALLLRIDSPGGTTTGSQIIYEELRRLSEKKPVVAQVGALADRRQHVARHLGEIDRERPDVVLHPTVLDGVFINDLATRCVD